MGFWLFFNPQTFKRLLLLEFLVRVTAWGVKKLKTCRLALIQVLTNLSSETMHKYLTKKHFFFFLFFPPTISLNPKLEDHFGHLKFFAVINNTEVKFLVCTLKRLFLYVL